jgi:hypothetical protein
MSKPTNAPSREPICKPTNDLINDQTTHEMNEQTEIPLQQSGTHANVSQQLVPVTGSEGATLASKTAHQLPTLSHSMNNLWQCQSFVDNVRSQLIDSWQCQMEINKMKSKTIIPHSKKQSETIRTCSTNQIKQDTFPATFKLVVASVSNNVSVDLWQCQMEIESTNSLVGFCHGNKSEQVTCSEQGQDAKLPSKIHDPSNTQPLTNNLWQCQSFVNNLLINLF